MTTTTERRRSRRPESARSLHPWILFYFLWMTVATTTFCHAFHHTPAFFSATRRAASDTHRLFQSSSSHEPYLDETGGVGLYHGFCQHALELLEPLGLQPVPVDDDLPRRSVPQKGTDSNNTVRIQSQAFCSSDDSASHGIRYARYSLLETLSPINDDASSDATTPVTIHTTGIQVLNLVLFPVHPLLPVWGADFVSLPGNKHLVLLDAQPMIHVNATNIKEEDVWNTAAFTEWYQKHDISQAFPWGGDFPPAIRRFVSPTALWSRLGLNQQEEPLEQIQGPLYQAFQQHVHLYLDSVAASASAATSTSDDLSNNKKDDSQLDDYLAYRLDNDPARPMLTSLFGKEWTERLLQQVLFPKL